MQGELRLRGLHDHKRSRGATEVEQATAVGGDVLVVASVRAEEVAEFVVAAAEALGRGEALEAPHPSRAPFHAAVVLLEPVIMGWPAPLPCGARLAGQPEGRELVRCRSRF